VGLVFLSGIIACAPRAGRFGFPQHEYEYAVPEKIDDGWEISSLSKEGVDPENINVLIREVLNKNLKDIYSDGLTMLLGGIIKRSTGMYADEFAEKHLFTPLGISEYSWTKSPGGSVITAWGLSLKPRDMAKIGYLFLKNGKWNDRQIISQKWVSESTKAQITEVTVGYGYGYQWWCGEKDIYDQFIKVYYAAGMGGQLIFVSPSSPAVRLAMCLKNCDRK
jgi:CubicO group peptidase (beta-lactamase class C family)